MAGEIRTLLDLPLTPPIVFLLEKKNSHNYYEIDVTGIYVVSFGLKL